MSILAPVQRLKDHPPLHFLLHPQDSFAALCTTDFAKSAVMDDVKKAAKEAGLKGFEIPKTLYLEGTPLLQMSEQQSPIDAYRTRATIGATQRHRSIDSSPVKLRFLKLLRRSCNGRQNYIRILNLSTGEVTASLIYFNPSSDSGFAFLFLFLSFIVIHNFFPSGPVKNDFATRNYKENKQL